MHDWTLIELLLTWKDGGFVMKLRNSNSKDVAIRAENVTHLGRNEDILIRACHEYYTPWIAYLSEREAYRDFADYLLKHRNALSAESIVCFFGMRELFAIK